MGRGTQSTVIHCDVCNITMSVDILQHEHIDSLRRLLHKDSVANIFLLDMLDVAGIAPNDNQVWYGHWSKDMLNAAVLFCGTPSLENSVAIPFGDALGCRYIGSRAYFSKIYAKTVFGPCASSDALWKGLGARIPTHIHTHKHYFCEKPPIGPGLPLRCAEREDLPVIAKILREIKKEDIGLYVETEAYYQEWAKRVIQKDDAIVGEENGEIVFYVGFGTYCSHGAEFEGVYVPPKMRRSGIGIRGGRTIIREALLDVPFVTMHVNENNIPAIRAYEKIGFVLRGSVRLIVR